MKAHTPFLRRVTMAAYRLNPERYELRSGREKAAHACPYGNRYTWIGYDLEDRAYVRFTKSVFKKLIKGKDAESCF